MYSVIIHMVIPLANYSQGYIAITLSDYLSARLSVCLSVRLSVQYCPVRIFALGEH